jgi:hypothetical protein
VENAVEKWTEALPVQRPHEGPRSR